jgi:hypothetical protein
MEILNERPEGMSYAEYKLRLKSQKKIIKNRQFKVAATKTIESPKPLAKVKNKNWKGVPHYKLNLKTVE